MTTLHELADKARAAFPHTEYKHGGSRINAAVELVESNAVTSMGIMPATGHDYWSVGDYTVTIAGKHCNCPDMAAPLHNGGKLCKHRLAAMFVHRLNQSRVNHLENLLKNAPGDALTLRVNVYYLNVGRDYQLTGHHYPGHPWERYIPERCFHFDESMFNAALRAAGWEIDGRPSKQGIAYHYQLVRAGSTPSAGLYTLHASAHETLERQDQAARFAEIEQTQQLLAEMEAPHV